MDDQDASPPYHEYLSAYDQAGLDQDWLSELSEEWISNGSSEPSEQGSARGMSIRAAFAAPSKIETIPEEAEISTVRIVLGETDAQNAPEWKRRLEEARSPPKDLFSPCHLENLFIDETTRSSKPPSQQASPNVKHSIIKERSLTNSPSLLKDISENVSIKSTRSPKQQSPLRQVYVSADTSSSFIQDAHATTGSPSSGKSTIHSSDEKSTHESSDEDSSLGDPNEDFSIAEPTQTLMDPPSFYSALPHHDEITVHTPPQTDSADESFQTARVAQTPHPNGLNSLSSSMEVKSRSVRFAPPDDAEQSFAFDFTPQLPIEERPQTPPPQTSAKNTPHNSPLKLFSRYDTFTNNKMEDLVANLLPKPDDDEDDVLRSSREYKRARREAMSRDRVPRLPQNQEIRHTRMPSLTTQEMFDDAEDFMRDLRSMPRPATVETEEEKLEEIIEESAVEEVVEYNEGGEGTVEEEDFGASTIDEGNVSSDFEEHPLPRTEYSQHSESEAYDSIREVQSPGRLPALSPGKATQIPLPTNPNPASRVSSAESMQVITPDDVAHILPTTVGSMTFDPTRNAWFRVRASQMSRNKIDEDESVEVNESPEEDEEEDDIFGDIDDLVLTDEEESQEDSRPSSSGETDSNRHHTYEEEVDELPRMSPGEKERGSAQEYPAEKSEIVPQRTATPTIEAQATPIPPPKSPMRKSISSPLPSPSILSPTKSLLSVPPSPHRQPLQVSLQQVNSPTPKSTLGSPIRSPHRKTPSTDKRMRKSLPLPPLDTPEAIRQSQLAKGSPKREDPIPRRSQYEHLMATPLLKRPAQMESPFFEPPASLCLSISPPPADISFANTPRQDISFSVTTRILVKHLTDFEPFEPYWEKLRYIDFHGKNVTSLDGLKSFCPKLEELDIKDCKVKYLTGLPSTMRILKANGNRFDGLVSFAWGRNIQYLDLANNEIDSLAGLSTLIHLREVRVDNNLLTSLDGILQLDGLLKVTARHNQINSLDFTSARLPRLEVLECQQNCISWVEGFEELSNLMSLHLDDNNITILQPKHQLRSLRTLKLCRNELETFDPKYYPELRTLYLDENQIQSLGGVRKLRLLENFSARSQRGKTNIAIHGLNELRKVYLSGNPIPLRLDRPFYNLQYLELAAVKLTVLPQDFASKVPNLRILNLSFNSLKDITPIRGMALLKRLFLIGNRLSSLSDGTTETLLSLTELQVLDLRLSLSSPPSNRSLNPITLSFYPPVEAKKSDHHKDMFSLVTGRQAQSTWQQRDKAFRNGMPRSWELRRKAYQGLVYTACPKLRWFDGSEVSRGNVAEGERVLKTLEGVVSSVRSTRGKR